MAETYKPLLCRLGLHSEYKYLPKVSGDLGKISIACKRCGYGYRYFAGIWDIRPEEVQDEIKEQARIEYGRILSFLNRIHDPLMQLKMALDILEDSGKFTPEELEPIKQEYKGMTKVGGK